MKDLAQALCSNSKLIKLAVKPDGRKKTRFCDEGNSINFQLSKGFPFSFGTSKEWEISDLGTKTSSPFLIVQRSGTDHAAWVTRPGGKVVTSMPVPEHPGGKFTFELDGQTYTWRVFRNAWRLQLTLIMDANQKQMAVLDLNGTCFNSNWKKGNDTISIRGDKEDKEWLGVVIATGMAAAKAEKKEFTAQLGNGELTSKDQVFEPRRFSMDDFAAPALKPARSGSFGRLISA